MTTPLPYGHERRHRAGQRGCTVIGLDKNVLVRYIMQDDPKHSSKASRLIESLDSDNPGYITLVSVIELYWVLTTCYALTDEQVGEALDAILRTKQFLVEHADHVMRALRVVGQGKAELAGCLIESSAAGAGCTQTMTLLMWNGLSGRNDADGFLFSNGIGRGFGVAHHRADTTQSVPHQNITNL